MSFQDKVVIVTGSSSGIGAATAIMFAEEGAKVTLVGRNQQKLKNVARQCGLPLVVVADVSKDEDAKRVIDETIKRYGRLDILINNAGIAPFASILAENAMEIFDRTISTNLRAVVHLTNLATPYLKESKGNIVNVSSIAALRVLGMALFAYYTSKAGLDHFSRAVAQELAPSGVRVNVVNPGPVLTDIYESQGATKEMMEAALNSISEYTALKRYSEPEEIADLILFLASDKAKAITGSCFVSDNGVLIKTPDPVI